MPVYQVIIPKTVEKQVRKLDPKNQTFVKNALHELSINPYQKNTVKLKTVLLGMFRIRVGDYRIRYDIHKTTVIIRRVGHRRDVYER